jgi:hypothetical protein
MDEGAATPRAPARVVPLRVAAQPPPPLEELVEQSFRIAFGIAALASEVLVEAVARTLGHEPYGDGEVPTDERAAPPTGLPLFLGASIGLAVEMGRWAGRALTTVVRGAELMTSYVTGSSTGEERMVGSGLRSLDSRWREHRPKDEHAASEFLRLLVPQVVDAVLDQVDLNDLVRSRVDLEGIVAGVDLDRVAGRLDLEAIVARVDLDAIVERIDMRAVVERIPLDAIIDRIDVDAIVARVDLDTVAARLDVDAVAARLDVEAVVRRLDLVAIAHDVIEGIDLPEIIRDSMGSMTTETVGGIRVQSMNADRAISRLVDRVLQRRDERDATTPPELPPREPE